MYGAGRSRITHPFTSPPSKLDNPVRLACVKHASVHPEPESNPPQKPREENQHVTLKIKIDDHLIRKGASIKPHRLSKVSRPLHTGEADDGLAIIDYKEVVQIRS